ncbi:MAG: hypothetical protein ACI97A_001747 [Planctomycetota bacterium]|jgi:hypothetical protein
MNSMADSGDETAKSGQGSQRDPSSSMAGRDIGDYRIKKELGGEGKRRFILLRILTCPEMSP